MQLRACRRSTGHTIAVVFSLLAACCGGDRVVLGESAPPPYHFGAPKLLSELALTGRNDNPTLTADLLEIFFTSDRDDGNPNSNGNVWTAHRSDAALPFDAPSPVVEVNSLSFETSSAVSVDGLTLWFGSDRAGGTGDLDVWRSTRPNRQAGWSAPTPVPELNSIARDVPRPVGEHGRTMPLASQRDASDRYQTYLAIRASQTTPFATPRSIPELSYLDRSTVDAFLTDDGLTLLFSSGPVTGPADLYAGWRLSTEEAFSATLPLDDLNRSDSEERDPWLSPDGKLLFFVSDRDGLLNIYQATVEPR